MGRLNIAALSTFTFGLLFLIIAMMVSWGSIGESGFFEVRYGAFEGDVVAGDERVGSQQYSNPDLDDGDGVGLARAAGILFIIAAAVGGLAFLALENNLLLPKSIFAATGATAAGLAALLALVALILLPIGISGMAEDDVSWGFGLAAGIIATLALLVGAVLAAASILKTTGFKLELADAAPRADFD